VSKRDASASEHDAECERASAMPMPMPMRAKSDKVANGRIRCLGAYRVAGGSSTYRLARWISRCNTPNCSNAC